MSFHTNYWLFKRLVKSLIKRYRDSTIANENNFFGLLLTKYAAF